MAEDRGLELELYNQWFLLADLDKDGVVSGGEAVQFFARSRLPQKPTLFKVWQYVAGDRPHLNRQEFYTAMKLVSSAQLNSGVLDDQQALRLINGLAGRVPPPQMQGLPIPQGLVTQAANAPSSQQPQLQQRPAGIPPTGIPAQQQGQGFAAFPSDNQYPPLTPDQAAAFQTAFSQLDTDNDGYVQGVECFPAFMRSGLPKQTLKDVWDVVAGNDGKLSRHQFVQCLYLIECCKRGIAVPKQLPTGQFPPVAAGVDISSMMGYQQPDIYSTGPLTVPPLPERVAYQPGPPPQVAFQSQVPGLSTVQLAILPEAERQRLEAERENALKQEAERKKLEEERLAAAARREFFTQSLAGLRMAQSKVSRTVVEAQQRLELEKADADQMEADYMRAYEQFSIEHARAAPVVEALRKMEEEKAGLTQKLEALKATVAQLESYDPDWEVKERGECEALNKEIAALLVRKESLQLVADGIENQRSVLETQIAALKEVSEGMEGSVLSLREQVQKATAEGAKDKDAVVALLKQVAPMYNKLYDAAKQAMIPLPAEALATVKREPMSYKYDPYKLAGAADLESFSDEGFRIVSALPVDDRMTNFTSPSLASALEESEKTAAEVEETVEVEPKKEEDNKEEEMDCTGEESAAIEEKEKVVVVDTSSDVKDADAVEADSLAVDADADEVIAGEEPVMVENETFVPEESTPPAAAAAAAADDNDANHQAPEQEEEKEGKEEVSSPVKEDKESSTEAVADAFGEGFEAALASQEVDAAAAAAGGGDVSTLAATEQAEPVVREGSEWAAF